MCGDLQGSAAQRQEAAQARAQAVDVLLRVGLAALAVSDYIRTVLCPQLQGHEPEPALPGICKQVSVHPKPCRHANLQGSHKLWAQQLEPLFFSLCKSDEPCPCSCS